jgi:hypothetical protein
MLCAVTQPHGSYKGTLECMTGFAGSLPRREGPTGCNCPLGAMVLRTWYGASKTSWVGIHIIFISMGPLLAQMPQVTFSFSPPKWS